MDLKGIKTVKEISEEYNIPIRTIHNRIVSCRLIENVDYKKFGERIGTILSPSGIEKILKKY